jgi:hypothetical protein
MLSFSISYQVLIKFPYFVNLVWREDRGERGSKDKGENKMSLKKALMFS